MTNKTNPIPYQAAVDASEKLTMNKQISAEERTKLFSKKQRGRFTLDLEVLEEENAAQVLFGVQEKNVEYLEGTNERPFCFLGLSDEYSKDEGFPDVLDLSRYFVPDESGKLLANPKDGRSLFAVEFDRLNGKLGVEVDDYCAESSIASEGDEEDVISRENTKRIEQMSHEQLLSAQREIFERFDPKIVEFLRERSQRKAAQRKAIASTRKPSRFKQIRGMSKEGADDLTKEVKSGRSADMVVDEMVKELEVFPNKIDETHGVLCDDKNAAYTRLAVEAVQLDFATKCLKRIIPRQQQNVVRLFDSFLTPLEGYEGKDELLEMARSNIPAIKGLYLEEMNSEKGATTYQFTGGLNPLTDGAWTLLPIRNVLDTCQKDFGVAVEDVVVVRLCLLWTLLMMTERGSLFHACNKPEDVYVRLAEVFLIGR
ncbi:unnamed protein product [Toxocara canis]|uniref:RPAP1_N domain-containing protein n=1 Tax=Toxocara canis TaxID=6265 RepID=A0A183VDA0_TOXCA|nr:unnamed protein product [Toxocara canis]